MWSRWTLDPLDWKWMPRPVWFNRCTTGRPGDLWDVPKNLRAKPHVKYEVVMEKPPKRKNVWTNWKEGSLLYLTKKICKVFNSEACPCPHAVDGVFLLLMIYRRWFHAEYSTNWESGMTESDLGITHVPLLLRF